jgi:hypothetical protein
MSERLTAAQELRRAQEWISEGRLALEARKERVRVLFELPERARVEIRVEEWMERDREVWTVDPDTGLWSRGVTPERVVRRYSEEGLALTLGATLQEARRYGKGYLVRSVEHERKAPPPIPSR